MKMLCDTAGLTGPLKNKAWVADLPAGCWVYAQVLYVKDTRRSYSASESTFSLENEGEKVVLYVDLCKWLF